MNLPIPPDILRMQLDASQASLLLVFNEQGDILEGNRCVQSILGDSLQNKSYQDVFLDFRGDMTFASLLEDSGVPRLLSLSRTSAMPQTFYFTFYRDGNRVYAFGELDYAETERLRRHLVSANNELINLGRDLHKANAELRRLNELKNEFLGMAAHDLRTPIGNIASLSDMLLEDVVEFLPESQVEFVITIKSLSEFLLTLLENLLDITAFESGKLRIAPETQSLEPLLERAAALSRLYARKKNIEVELLLPEASLPKVVLDATKIAQVLDNLISNAVKYSPVGSRVRISAAALQGKVRVSIADQGCGIRPEDMSKIFKPFVKTASRTTANEKSTGLGLCIVQRIVAAHQGRVWAESEPGQGSVFYFELMEVVS